MPSAGMQEMVDQIWQQCQHRRMSEVAKDYGLTTQRIVALLQQSGLVEGGNRDPSRLEIQEACQEIRQRWTPEQMKSRWVGKRRLNYRD